MTYNPPTLQALGAFWTAQGGVNLGVVGDTAHAAKGYSYHLGKDQLTADAYSRRTARDVAGLTNAASAIDLGKLGTLVNLRAFSFWLVDCARFNEPGTSDMREIIYSPDGRTVLRWDRERGHTSEPRPGEADDSHLTHTHVSWYRDAEAHDHRTAFAPYFSKGSTMSIYTRQDQPGRFTIPAGKAVRGWQPDGDGWKVTKTWTAQPTASSGPYDYTLGRVSGTASPSSLLHVPAGFFAGLFISSSEVGETADPTPVVDCADQVAAEHERTRALAIAAVEAI